MRARPNLKLDIQRIADQYPVFQCIACAAAIRSFLEQNGISGQLLRLSTGSTVWPYSNIYHIGRDELISQNNRHEAISVILDGEEIIFDNLHPTGISRQDWLANFDSPILDAGQSFLTDEIPF